MVLKLTWVDYLAVIAVLRGCYVGFKSGFFPEILRLASYVITAVVTFRFKDIVAEYFTLHTFLNSATADIVALALLIVITLGLTKLIQIMLLKMLKVGDGGVFNKVGGTLLGAGRWILLLSFLFMMIARSPLETLKADIGSRSVTGSQISMVAQQLFDFLATVAPQLGMEKPEKT